jgi:uncharacterized membrane protein
MELNKPVEVGKSQLGDIDGHIVAVLCYIFAPISSLIFFLTEKENDYVRFAAMQSLISGVISVIIGSITCGIGSLVVFVFQILALIKALNKEYYKMPLIGNLAEKWAAKPGATPPPPAA